MSYMKSELRAEAEAHGHVKRPILKAIRAHCLDCCVGQAPEVRKCAHKKCNLWPYRTGKNPFTGNAGNPATLKRDLD
jgi:hypothetical protein